MNTRMHILLLSDNKAGHVTNSMGILKAIEKLVAVELVVLQVHLRLKFMRYPLRALLNRPALLRRMPAATQRLLIRSLYRLNDPRLLDSAARFDWIVSSGGDTSFLNAWLAKLYGIRNCYGSSLRGLNPALFTLLLSIVSGPVLANEVRLDLMPTPIDNSKLLEQGRQFRATHNLQQAFVWAVLIGGSGAGYRYNAASIKQLAGGLLALAQRSNARLLITTSRRTGLKLEQTLQAALGDHPAVAYATFYNHRPEKVVASFLGAADAVFCTADSGAMITEGMTAGKPVYVLEPEQVKPQPYNQSFLQKHTCAHRIMVVPFSDLPSLDVRQDDASYFCLLKTDCISVLAEKIKPWFQPAA